MPSVQPSEPRSTKRRYVTAATEKASDRSAPEQTERTTLHIQQIKLTALRLCELVVEEAPKGSRLEQALGSIRAGVSLGIDVIKDYRGLR